MTMETPKKLLCVLGPTASGKTALAVELALALDGEVVSCDSMQVYQGLDIGTAKPTTREMRNIPHHMLGICPVDEAYSVAKFVEDAQTCVEDILSRGKLPILAGGTGLYMDALINGREFSHAEEDLTTRHQLEDLVSQQGIEPVRELLRLHDPESYDRLHPNDQKRIIRAAEVWLTTGKTITQHNQETGSLPPRYPTVKIGLNYQDRAVLYARIDRRVDLMLEQGLLEEARQLLENHQAATAAQAIGYKEFAGYFRGDTTLEAAADLVKQESRRYAKRQLTWLRRDKDIHWITLPEDPDMGAVVPQALDIWHNNA